MNELYKQELLLLANARSKRIRPQTDTKLILAWNALVGSGLLRASISLKSTEFFNNAITLAESLERFWDVNTGSLLHQITYASQPIYAFLDDCSAFGLFLVQLYNETAEEIYLVRLKQIITSIYRNHLQKHGLFSFQSNLNEVLIAQKYEITDSVMPASNSMLCELLLWSGVLLNDPQHTINAKSILAAVLEQAAVNPLYHANWLRIYSEWFENPLAVVKYNVNKFCKRDLPEIQVNWVPIKDQSYMFMVCIGDTCLAPCENVNQLMEQYDSI